MLSNSAQWLSPLELDRHQSATPSPACFPTQTFWSINQSLGALLVLLNTDNGTKRSAKNIWVCWMCPDVTIQRPGHQSGGDHGSLWPHDHTSPAHLLLLSWPTQLQCYIPTIRDVNTSTSTLNMFVKTGYLQSMREEIVWRMSCRYMCLCRHVYSEQISLTWAEQFKHNYKQQCVKPSTSLWYQIVPKLITTR